MRAQEFVTEVSSPGELDIPEGLLSRFTDAGYNIEGEGRDQITLSRPNNPYVLKIVGSGDARRTELIKKYVNFFRQHQRNPHFPRVGGDRTIRWNGENFYAYTQERLYDLSGDEAVLDYLEYAMGEIGHGQEPRFDRIPPGLTVEQIEGMIEAIDEMFESGLGNAGSFDLTNVANIMQRANSGTLIIVDPFGLMNS
jgi:hypothetical protein